LVDALNTPGHEDRDVLLKVDAERKRRLTDKSNRVAYDAEWRVFLRECRKEVVGYCRRLQRSPEDTAEIEDLVVQRLPKIVAAFDPDRDSGAGFRTFLRKPIEFARKDHSRSPAAERTELGVFSVAERIGDADGSGASEVPPIAREVLNQTWDESTPVSRLELIEEKESWEWRASLFVENSRFTRQEKRFFKQVELDHRPVEDVAANAKVEVSTVIEAVDRVRKAVERGVPRKLKESGASETKPQPAQSTPESRGAQSTVFSASRQVESVRVSIASPKQIRAQSSGEVYQSKTLDPRSLRPVKGGLMCERIFGPMNDWNCECGKSHGPSPPGSKCPRCGMELLPAAARRQRMGHIELAAPILNGWLFKANASIVLRVLAMKRADLDALIYRGAILVLDPGKTNLRQHQVLDHQSFEKAQKEFGAGSFKSKPGAEGFREALAQVDLGKCLVAVEAELAETECCAARKRCLAWSKKLRALIESGQRLEWIVMDVLPVLPAGLRPEIPIPVSNDDLDRDVDSGRKVERHRFATSDLNRLYRRVLVGNQKVKELQEACAPEAIVYHRITRLQKALDALLHIGRPALPNLRRRALKSLAESLEGKGGRFRGNLLGKRVDYSGRAVIVVGPELKLHQCGIPLKMGLKLFEPFLVRQLKLHKGAASTKAARRLLDSNPSENWDNLKEVANGKLVLLNRAPTLHRLSVQAFEPVFVTGDAIRLHPMACAAFGADFDGDQMAVHLPLSDKAQQEAREMMMPRANMLSPANGQPVFAPSQEIVLGCFYLSLEPVQPADPRSPPALCGSKHEVLSAWDLGRLKTHDRIRIPNPDCGFRRPYGNGTDRFITTTVGRVVLNDSLHEGVGFANEDLGFVNHPLEKRGLNRLVATCHRALGVDQTLNLLDRLKDAGFNAATRSGISVGITDLIVPSEKDRFIAEAKTVEAGCLIQANAGIITEGERRERAFDAWRLCTEKLKQGLRKTLAINEGRSCPNPLWLMLESRARGSEVQVAQLAGMRGIMVKNSGEYCALPVTSNFREGLSPPEFFVSTYGARKGLGDRSLATSECGYLTRRLVHAVHDVLISMEDCGAIEGKPVKALKSRDATLVPLANRLVGRTVALDVVDPTDSETIWVEANSAVTPENAEQIENGAVECVMVRSVLTCRASRGICARCYGIDPSTGSTATVGTPVGVIAAQSIGEPGTQLTMRTFHLGGVATGSSTKESDITGGLPRVNELFEGRNRKDCALVAPMDGIVSLQESPGRGRAVIIRNQEAGSKKRLRVHKSRRILVTEGEMVHQGDCLTDGQPVPAVQISKRGLLDWQSSVIDEVLTIYAVQGATIADQHIEIVVRAMSRWVRIIEPGGSCFSKGELVQREALDSENARLQSKGGIPPSVEPCVVGIGKLPAMAEDFLTSAAFERTSAVLAEAALDGRSASKPSMAKSVITGGLIAAGSGFAPSGMMVEGSLERTPRGSRLRRRGQAKGESS